MTCTTIRMKSGDSETFTSLLSIDGTAVDLTGSTVLFLLRSIESPATSYSLAATIVNAATGSVSYTSGAGFPTAAGKYRQEWQVTFSDGSIVTFPNDGYNTIAILDIIGLGSTIEPWILADGVWNDAGMWIDTATWID